MKWRILVVVAGVLLILAVAVPLGMSAFHAAQGPVEIKAKRHVAARPVLGPPKLTVESTRHSFGTMEIGQQGEHWFTIRNDGADLLELRVGKTSCSCTLVDLEDGKVPPGGEVRVRLRWTPPKPAELFAQGATIHSNDPDRPSVHFSIVGEVKSFLATSAESLVFTDVPVGESATRELVVYSQGWKDFDLQAQCSSPQFSVSVAPADAAVLETLEAVSGHVVTVSLSSPKSGTLRSELNLTATRRFAELQDQDNRREISVPVGAIVVGNVWLEGPNLVERELIKLGTIPLGKGKQRKMSLFVRGSQQDVKVTEIQAEPRFLQVRVGTREQVSSKLSRYRVEIEIPSDAPVAACVGLQAGEIRISTDHPDAPQMRMKVDFAVVEPQ